MTDDLRTRAREAARAELGPFPCMSNDEADSYEDGFVDGALWHAAGAELVNRRTR